MSGLLSKFANRYLVSKSRMTEQERDQIFDILEMVNKDFESARERLSPSAQMEVMDSIRRARDLVQEEYDKQLEPTWERIRELRSFLRRIDVHANRLNGTKWYHMQNLKYWLKRATRFFPRVANQ